MNGLAFFDTNILVYADNTAFPRKQAIAIDLYKRHVREGTAVLSLQVLQEYYVVATRKLAVSAELAQQKVEVLARGPIVRFTPGDVISAIELHRLARISFWDALVVHAARIAGCAVLYSEDLHAGSAIGGVRVVNPFEGLD